MGAAASGTGTTGGASFPCAGSCPRPRRTRQTVFGSMVGQVGRVAAGRFFHGIAAASDSQHKDYSEQNRLHLLVI